MNELYDGNLQSRTDSSLSLAVYRRNFLRPSETFVRDHLAFLQRVAATVVTSNLLPDAEVLSPVPVHWARDPRVATKLRLRLPRRFRGNVFQQMDHALEAALEALAPDVLHVHFGTDAAVVFPAAQRLGIPTVITWHGYDATVRDDVFESQATGRVLLQRRQQMLDSAAAHIAVSQFIADELVSRGASRETITVIPCGVDSERFTWSEPPAGGGVLFVGRLVEKKGCADLIEAVAQMEVSVPVTVIGDGPLRGPLETLAARLGVRVDFRGFQDSTEVLAAMRANRVVAMPSKRAQTGDCEGLPVASLEAAAIGRPVVGYAHSGLRDSVVDGRTGFLVEEGDVVALSQRLSSVLDDPVLSRQFSAAGREHVANFDIRQTTDRIESLYERVATRRSIGARAVPASTRN